jgi:hypothetical protein
VSQALAQSRCEAPLGFLLVDKLVKPCYNTYTTEQNMKYTLITAKGKLYTFFVLAVAETYQQAYGGTLFDNSVVQTAEVVL